MAAANINVNNVQDSLMNSFEILDNVNFITNSFEILSDKDLFEDQKSEKISKLQLKHNENLKKSADLKKKLRKALEKNNKEDALKIIEDGKIRYKLGRTRKISKAGSGYRS